MPAACASPERACRIAGKCQRRALSVSGFGVVRLIRIEWMLSFSGAAWRHPAIPLTVSFESPSRTSMMLRGVEGFCATLQRTYSTRSLLKIANVCGSIWICRHNPPRNLICVASQTGAVGGVLGLCARARSSQVTTVVRQFAKSRFGKLRVSRDIAEHVLVRALRQPCRIRRRRIRISCGLGHFASMTGSCHRPNREN